MGRAADELAQEIRMVDGAHDLGAGALAIALLPWLARRDAAVRREALEEAAEDLMLDGDAGIEIALMGSLYVERWLRDRARKQAEEK